MSAVVATGVVAVLGRDPGAVALAGIVPMNVVVAIGGFVSRSMGDVVQVVVGVGGLVVVRVFVAVAQGKGFAECR